MPRPGPRAALDGASDQVESHTRSRETPARRPRRSPSPPRAARPCPRRSEYRSDGSPSHRPSGCAPVAPAASGIAQTLRGPAATGGWPPDALRTSPRSARRPHVRHPSACGGRPRVASSRRCNAPASSGWRLESPSPGSLFVRAWLRCPASSVTRSSVPSNESVFRRAPLLGRVPWSGFPHVIAPIARSDLSAPDRLSCPCRIVPRCRGATRLHPRFLDNPCVHAPLYDPGEQCDQNRGARPYRSRIVASCRLRPPVGPRRSPNYQFRDPISRPTRSLSTLRDHGRPCTSLRSRKTRFRRGGLRRRRWDSHPGLQSEVLALLHGPPLQPGFSWRPPGLAEVRDLSSAVQRVRRPD